jgi:hypothetical protein
MVEEDQEEMVVLEVLVVVLHTVLLEVQELQIKVIMVEMVHQMQ